jgi:asparagine synthase (glutamine-hydrolysing)
MSVFLPDDYLVKVDRASMAWGLEARPPLLDHELLELAATIPSRFKIHRGESKYIFKQAIRPRLPAGHLDRPKRGFEIPIDNWLRGPLRPLVESSLFDSNTPIGDFIDRKTARRLVDNHKNGLGRHGQVLWSLVVLAKWCNRYLNSSVSLRTL